MDKIMSEWISVKKVFPKTDQLVLVINSKVDMLPVKCCFSEDSKEFICIESLESLPISVTHWMYLPERPKE